jgi:hypothetical protein
MPTANYSGTTTGSPTVGTEWYRYKFNIYSIRKLHRINYGTLCKIRNRKYIEQVIVVSN